MDTLKDINGKDSAKRLWASRYLTAGLFMAIIHFVAGIIMGILKIEFTFNFPFEIWFGLVGGGFAALGLTIFESKNK